MISLLTFPHLIIPDDCLLYKLSISHTTIYIQLQNNLDHLSSWACDWQMQFNETKCVSMCCIRSQSPIGSIYYFLNNHTLVSRQRPTSPSWCNLTQNSFMAPHTNSIDVKATNMLDSILTDVYLKPRKLPLSPTNTGILLLCEILIHYPIQLAIIIRKDLQKSCMGHIQL